jgi:hypothetical protein
MALFHRTYRRLRRWLGLLLRPRRLWLLWREWRRGKRARPVRRDIPLDSLPPVRLLPVREDPARQQVLVDIFLRNPSPLALLPQNLRFLREDLGRGVDYYLLVDDSERPVGGIAYRIAEKMPCHLVVEYALRKEGYGIAAMVEIEKLKRNEGVDELWGQVFKNNRPMLSLMLSLGYRFVEELEEEDFHVMVKPLRDEPSSPAVA